LRKLLGGIQDGFVLLAIEIGELADICVICASNANGDLVHNPQSCRVSIDNLSYGVSVVFSSILIR
jgi:hypothetical protein